MYSHESESTAERVNISGVFPHLGVKVSSQPLRTETGIGGLMPWADRLWFVTYVAHKVGNDTGLFSVDDDLRIQRHPASVVGTYANRMIHAPTNQCIIGPHAIDADGRVRTFEGLVDTRLTATCTHLTDPARKVYFLGMEGEFFEADVVTMKVTQLFNLGDALEMGEAFRPHFKDAFTAHGRVVVANNSYYSVDFGRDGSDGRLAEWDGRTWTVLGKTQYNTVTGRTSKDLGEAIYAVGQDRASAILKVFLPREGWMTYRLPKGTHTQDHAWTTEWPRIREVESERWLMNASGMFYELPAMTYADRVWGIRPVCTHLRIVGDFCSWNGLLVMAGDQTTPISDSNAYVGQPQANLWLGKPDDLWQWGKPAGWGGPWWDTPVRAGEPSDPYLMTGFEHKCLHVQHEGGGGVKVDIEVDFMGIGRWARYHTIETSEGGYGYHVFPDGFSAHWLRLTPHTDGVATAQAVYT